MEARREKQEALSLSQAAEYLLAECRMVLPGIQGLFGFQLIAVFNPSFSEKLGQGDQRLHLAAITLVAMAVALIMTPAAYHRQSGGREVNDTFIVLSTRLLLWSMPPLALGICIDSYLIGKLILRAEASALLAAVLLAVFVLFWFVLPRAQWLHRSLAGQSRR